MAMRPPRAFAYLNPKESAMRKSTPQMKCGPIDSVEALLVRL